MGVSSYIILTSGGDKEMVSDAMMIYKYQLIVNFLWSTFFFSFGWYLFSFLWLVLLWVLILLMIRSFGKISKTAALLQIPYLLWVSFAGYLNLGIGLLN
jgi:tryptophan-rich sensory protein